MFKGMVAFVDDEAHVRMSVEQTLGLAGLKTFTFASAEPILERLSRDWPGILVTDVKMPGMDGLELMRRALAIDPDLPVVLVTAHGGVPMAVQAMRDGAYDFIEKPFSSETLIDIVRRAIEKRCLVLENRGLRSEIQRHTHPVTPILGKSPLIERLRLTVANVADSDADVLITGETGTGKELVAQSLHMQSPRRNGRFVPVNCGAIPETMIESELFGHEAGAFTGARERRIGKFEFAGGGTLFLDEIESMPTHLQVKLLRVIQDRIIERLGSNERLPVDVRILAATKADLPLECEQGRFREDLFYRLNVVAIHVPPLRDHREDIPLLFQEFISRSASQHARPVPLITPTLMGELLSNRWPGNVRELQNAAERYVLQQSTGSPGQPGSSNGWPAPDSEKRLSLREQTAAFEKTLIEQELARQGGNVKAACKALLAPRKTLYDKMVRYGIKRAHSA